MVGRELTVQNLATRRLNLQTPTYWFTKPRMPSRQDERKQEDKGLLDEINDTILGEKERGREEITRHRYG